MTTSRLDPIDCNIIAVGVFHLMLTRLFGPSLFLMVLDLFLDNPDDLMNLREIARRLERNPFGLSKEHIQGHLKDIADNLSLVYQDLGPEYWTSS